VRRVFALAAVILIVPATAVSAASLEEVLERSRGASYTAEQAISCHTPAGDRGGLVKIEQGSDQIRVASVFAGDVEVSSGSGGWTLLRQGGVVSSASVETEADEVEPLYVIEETGAADHLGRDTMIHQLLRDGVLRAELVSDTETGALVAVNTFMADGSAYCERRFISFDPTPPDLEPLLAPTGEEFQRVEAGTAMPESMAGFDRLDLYEDDDEFRFAYYSDGFFSFAVFETPTTVTVDSAEVVELSQGTYLRAFTAGQVTFVWETPEGGMALVGDLPPDLHEEVLDDLPRPERPGLFRRLWRSLFG
jgi:hypothetical protein